MEDAVNAGSWYCGPPEGFVEYLKSVEEKYPGLEYVNVASSSVGTPQKVILEQLSWFAKEVMPAFKGRAAKPLEAGASVTGR